MGSIGVASWIAHVAFWILLLYGWAWGELGPKGVVVLLLVWVVGLYGLPHLPFGTGMFLPFVALLDIGLVFLIFKGDVRLT
jgi:hypothetical protein